ncbi:MAG: hypothetical protein WDM79_06165 [Terricaulis sp.]
MSQQRLFEFRMGERAPETLVVTAANRDAAQLLTEWQSWPGGALALVGPKGSGKTHLALAWAMETGARELAADASPEDAVERFERLAGSSSMGRTAPATRPCSGGSWTLPAPAMGRC